MLSSTKLKTLIFGIYVRRSFNNVQKTLPRRWEWSDNNEKNNLLSGSERTINSRLKSRILRTSALCYLLWDSMHAQFEGASWKNDGKCCCFKWNTCRITTSLLKITNCTNSSVELSRNATIKNEKWKITSDVRYIIL